MINEFKNHIKVAGNSELFNEKYGFKKIDYHQLLELYKDDSYIPYAQYLRTNCWETKRLEILDRDQFVCQNCGAFDTSSRQNKLGENVLEWSKLAMIFWTDSEGKERSSSLSTPEGKPDKRYNLQIHHKQYIVNRLPWDYDNKYLITLCNFCHLEEHQNNSIPVYDENLTLLAAPSNCRRCDGAGYIDDYRHVENGVCFSCGGTGYNIELINKKIH